MRKQRGFWFVVTVFCFVCQVDAEPLRVVALENSVADNGGGSAALIYTAFSYPTINRFGQVAFTALVADESLVNRGGVWSEAGGSGLRLTVLDGDVAPGVTNGIFMNVQDTYALINDSGQTAFRARLVAAPGIISTSNSGIWVATAGQGTTLVLREGDQAPPNAGAGAVFSETTDVAGQRFSVFNNQGRVAMQTSLQAGSGGITVNSDWGIWSAGGGYATRQAGREGTIAPGVLPSRFYQIINTSPSINDSGKTIFRAPLTNSLGGSANGSGIWLDDPAVGISLIGVQGGTAPGTGGATFNSLFGGIGINNANEYAFNASLTVGGSVSSANDTGIWAARYGNPQDLVARESDHAPGTDAAVGFGSFSGIRINGAGRIAFSGTLAGIPNAGESGVTTLNDAGIWSEGTNGLLQLVAREDSQAPGTLTGTLFSVFVDPAFNAAGQTAFTAELRGPDITAANNIGLWAQDAMGTLQLIVRRGDSLDVDPGPGTDERVVQNIAFWSDGGGEDGRRTGLNQYGQIAFAASFVDGTSGVFVSNWVANVVTGDFDNDGDVDGRDFLVWQRGASLNSQSPSDLAVWQANYGTGSLAATSVAVPEPASFLFFSLCVTAGALRRR